MPERKKSEYDPRIQVFCSVSVKVIRLSSILQRVQWSALNWVQCSLWTNSELSSEYSAAGDDSSALHVEVGSLLQLITTQSIVCTDCAHCAQIVDIVQSAHCICVCICMVVFVFFISFFHFCNRLCTARALGRVRVRGMRLYFCVFVLVFELVFVIVCTFTCICICHFCNRVGSARAWGVR